MDYVLFFLPLSRIVIADIWFILYILSIPSCVFVLDGRDSLDIALVEMRTTR